MTIRLQYVGHKSNRMLGEGIKRAGGALHAASNDFNQSLAILTAGNASIQDPQSVSQLLKTMSMRLNGASAADLEALGIDTTGMAQGKKSIIQQYKAMAGIDIMEGTDYKSTFQILDELYEKWDTLTMAERQAIAEASGGKRAGSVFASLMTNWEDARKVVEAAERGMTEHSAQKELENASKSVEFSLQRVRAAAQELAYDFLSSDFLKGAIEAFAKFIEVLDKVVEATHGVVPAVTAAAGAFYAFSTINGLMKTLGAGIKMLQKATDTETKSVFAQIAAKVKQIITERALAKAKQKTTEATMESTAAQKAETRAQQQDIGTNVQQTISEGSNKGKVVPFPGTQPDLTPVAEGAAGTMGAEGISLGTIAAVGGVIAALGALAAAAYAVKQSNEEMRESAQRLGAEYDSATKEIDDYKAEIEELQTTINSSNTSYEEARAARERLLGIQEALIDKYGKESGSIDLVTEAINGQVSALDKLKQKQWEITKAEYNKKSGLGIGDWLNFNTRNLYNSLNGKNQPTITNKTEALKDELYNAEIILSGHAYEDKEYLQNMQELFGGVYEEDTYNGILKISGSLEDLKENLLDMQSLGDSLDISSDLANEISNQIATAEGKLQDMGDMAQDIIFNDMIVPNEAYYDAFKQMEDAYAEYQDALVEQDEVKSKQMAQNAKESMSAVLKSMSGAPSQVKDFFEDMIPDVMGDIGAMQLEADLELKPVIKTDTVVDSGAVQNAKDNLEAELEKIDAWGLSKYRDQIQNQTLSSQYGNVDMDNRVVLNWDKENIEKFKEQLQDVTVEVDENGRRIRTYYDNLNEVIESGGEMLDTVNGAYVDYIEGMGEIEPIAISHLVQDDNGEAYYIGATTAQEYLRGILETAQKDGDTSIDHILELDKQGIKDAAVYDSQGREIAQHYIHGIIAGFGDEALDISELMHFSGKFGAIQLAQEQLQQAEQGHETVVSRTAERSQEAQKQLDSWLNDIRLFADEQELINNQGVNGTDLQNAAYIRLRNAAKSYGIELDDLIAKLRDMNLLSDLGRGDNKFVSSKIGAAWEGRTGLNFAEQNQSNMYSAMNELNSDSYNTLLSMSDDRLQSIGKQAQELAKEMGVTELSTEQWERLLQRSIDDFKRIDEATEALKDPFSMSEIVVAKEDLSSLSELYKSIVTQMEKDPAKVTVDISEVEKLRDKWQEIFGGEEGFDKFELDMSTVGNAADKLALLDQAASNYVDQQINMQGATDETSAALKSQLIELGYTKQSVDAVVESKMQAAQIENAVNASIAQGSSATAQYIELRKQEGIAVGLTNDELITYIAEMGNADGLQITGNEAWLAELRRELQLTEEELQRFISIFNAAGGHTGTGAGHNGMPSNVPSLGAQKASQRRAKSQLDAQLKFDELSNKFGSGGSKGGGGGGGGKSDAEKETDILKELSSQLDEIQAAYSSLNEIVEAYNENGKLTIDQAQQLINTDFRYLAMLTNQNGQLQLNEQGFQNLAKAKLQEMQIQLARNAIDTVNSLKTEADAVNFLTYAYEGLAGATLDATEAQLRMAVAAAHARGAKQGKAADKILAGYEATKVAIGNVDFGKDSLGGKKDSDKDKTDNDKNSKDADKKQEETKTKWNWLDRLVNKIQRTIDQLAKRAEKYFNYVEKNALVDKQLAANRRMIATQELSVTYYQNKASKYLKKVPKKYRSLISGDFDPAGIKNLVAELGSGKTKKLQDYLEWQDLLEKSQDALAEAYDNERSLITNKLDNILDYFDTLIGYQQNIQKGIEAQMNIRTAKGLGTDINDLLNIYGEQRNMIDTSAQRERAYIDQANAANNDIIKSYKDQIDNVSNGYQDTVAYQKLKNKGKQGRAKKELNSEYRVLAEDVDAYIKASKNQNKKGSKGQEARATMERLHKRYEDYVAELRKEQAEASAATSAALADQVQQNRTATDEMRAQIWETIKSVLDSLFETYERRVKSLDTVVNKWGTVAEALSDLDDDTIKRYGLRDMFGITAELSDVLLKQKQAINDEVAAYKNEYDLYQDMIAAAKSSTNEERMVRFRDILERQDLSGTSREKIEGFLEELVKGQDWQHTEWTTELEEGSNEVMSSILELVNTAEDIGEELLDKINESTNKLIDSLRALQEAYNAKAGLINDEWTVDSNGITDYGLAKVAALNDAANVARQIAAAHYKAYTNLVNISDEVRNDESFDEDAYNLELNKAVKDYYESVKDIHSAYDEIYQIANQSLQNEVDSLSKLIENYKEALNAKKSYYDYDKRLKEQNKNIQSITAEIQALNGVIICPIYFNCGEPLRASTTKYI